MQVGGASARRLGERPARRLRCAREALESPQAGKLAPGQPLSRGRRRALTSGISEGRAPPAQRSRLARGRSLSAAGSSGSHRGTTTEGTAQPRRPWRAGLPHAPGGWPTGEALNSRGGHVVGDAMRPTLAEELQAEATLETVVAFADLLRSRSAHGTDAARRAPTRPVTLTLLPPQHN